MICTLRWVRKITFLFFFFGFAPKFSTRFFASQDAKSTWGVRRQQHFFAGSRPNKCSLHVFGRGGRGIRRGREMYTKRFCAAKRAYPLQNADFLRIKRTKKKKHNQQSITDEASHASRQPRRTNSDSSTDRRPTTRGPIQIQGRARGTSYRSPTRAPLPRAYTERGRIGAEPSRVTRTLVWCLRVTTSRLERERERASSFRAPFECIDDDDGGPSSPSSRCLGDETTPNSA